MKSCMFQYFIVSQVDFIYDKKNIEKEFLDLSSEIFDKVVDFDSDYLYFSFKFLLWNADFIEFIKKNYIKPSFIEFDSYQFLAFQDKIILQFFGENKIHNVKPHINDPLRILSELSTTYFVYLYKEIFPIKEFKSYYNKDKDSIEIDEIDSRLNYLFKPQETIKKNIEEFSKFYNTKHFYRIEVLDQTKK